jgi:hypothetical protein
MKKTIFIGCLAAAFGFGFAGAYGIQEAPEDWAPPPPLQDKEMDRWIGTWVWTGTMNMMGQEMPYHAEETMKWDLGHQFVISQHQSFGAPGQVVYEALGVHRTDPEAKTGKLWWFDSHGTLTLFEGKQEGNVSVGLAKTDQGEMRSTVILNDDGTATHKMEMKEPGKDTWSIMIDATGKKKGQ